MKTAHALLALALLLPGGARADEPLTAGTGDVPVPKRVKIVTPDYPPEAQAQGLRGIVILEVTVDREGKVVEARVVRSVPPFDDAALAAVRQWQYEPPRVKGQPSLPSSDICHTSGSGQPLTFLKAAVILRPEGCQA